MSRTKFYYRKISHDYSRSIYIFFFVLQITLIFENKTVSHKFTIFVHVKILFYFKLKIENLILEKLIILGINYIFTN